jgi:hypothetical protein
MWSRSFRHSLLCLTVISFLAVLMLGCGSHNSMPNNLTAAQAQAIATALSNGASQAMTGAFGVASTRTGVNAMRRVEPAAPNVVTTTCTATSGGEMCTWPISSTFNCPGGGTMPITGMIAGTLSSTGDGSVAAQIAATPTNCSVDGLVLNGDPEVDIAGQINFSGSAPVYPVTGTETGGVKYGPSPSGSCQLNLTYTVNSNLSCTVTGTACGHSISGNC